MKKIEMKKFVNSKAKKGANLCERMFMHDEKGKEWL
jgi:hypothetical protein